MTIQTTVAPEQVVGPERNGDSAEPRTRSPRGDESIRPSSRVALYSTIVLAVLILIPSMLGFITKFLELLVLVQGDTDGAFAVTPVVNYLLASLGFFCLLCWATMNDMFRDIERPKHTFLDTEARLDANEK